MKAEQLTEVPAKTAPEIAPQVDPLEVLRAALELQRESTPTLNVEETISFAIANPGTEIVDSIGAVSIVCDQYGAYTPDNLIPQALLTHENFSTLDGLRKVTRELNKSQGRR